MEKVSRLLAAILLLAASVAAAQNNQQGVISGSVFRDSGLSLPGAVVTVAPAAASDSQEKKKPQAIKAVTDSRGEFAVRVPDGSLRYDVSVEAEGYAPETKQAQVEWGSAWNCFSGCQPPRSEVGRQK